MLPSLDTLEQIAAAVNLPVSAFVELAPGATPERASLLARMLAQASDLDDTQLAIAVEQIGALAKRRT